MAVSGVSSSKSIYGNRNVITGLASGMDTESMIENAISAYKNKISSLNQKRTKTEWKQEAYQSMISKMSSFLSKYTSYRSSNNLMSSSFFDQAVKTVSKGANKDMVSATGRASSDIQINRVQQLATAAGYTIKGSALDGTTSDFGSDTVKTSASGEFDLDALKTISTFSGSMSLAYGGGNALTYLTIDFDESKTYNNAQELADEINAQLKTQSVSIGASNYTGENLLKNVLRAEANEDGSITFVDPKKNNVYISQASDSVKSNLLGGKTPSTNAGQQIKSLNAKFVGSMQKTMSTQKYLEDRGSISITLDGVTKTIKMPSMQEMLKEISSEDLRTKIEKDEMVLSESEAKERDAAYIKALQAKVDDAFGKGKMTVSDLNAGEEGKGIRFGFSAPQNGSTFSVSSSVGKTLGFGESEQITSYLNTGKTLGELLGDEAFTKMEKVYKKDNNGNFIYKKDVNGDIAKDIYGNPLREEETDDDGNSLYSFVVNGKEVGKFTQKTTLGEVMNTMNNNKDCGVKVAYSKLTNSLSFTAKDTGAGSRIDFSPLEGAEGDSLAAKLFGDTSKADSYKAGQDAIFEISVNGTTMNMTRSSNSVELDGMTVNLKGTFGYQTDENGEIKYEDSGEKAYSYDRNEAGQIIFKADGGREVYGKERDDGTVELTSNGIDLKYKPADTTSPYADAAVYGRFNKETGALDFFMKDKDGGNEKQVYLQQGNWFSTNKNFNGNPSVDFKTAVTEEAVMKPVADKSAEAVTFETSSDADKIVDVVKQMVEDYNAMAKEIKDAYSTLPAQKSNGAYYEPLTAEEEEEASESFIKSWNEKAKQGALFGDRDLASLYQRLTSAISMNGENGAALREAGISVNYSNGLSTLEFNEDKFRAALNNDPDKVRDAFTASVDSGAKSNGLMQALKQPLDIYGKTEGGKGVLVEKAGSPLAPSTMYNNNIQQELNRIDDEIQRWQDKMEDQVDYYTNQFSRLEQLIQQMNSQSSYFSQLMGG